MLNSVTKLLIVNMGMITSKDTRRISFDNTFALSTTALAVSKSLENENIIGFNDLAPESGGDLIFTDKIKHVDVPDDGELDYWSQRIENLKKEHQMINKIVEAAYDKQIEHIAKEYEGPTLITQEKMIQIKPCFDWRTKIMKCYEDNPHQPLVCSSYVQAFTNCVASCRDSS